MKKIDNGLTYLFCLFFLRIMPACFKLNRYGLGKCMLEFLKMYKFYYRVSHAS